MVQETLSDAGVHQCPIVRNDCAGKQSLGDGGLFEELNVRQLVADDLVLDPFALGLRTNHSQPVLRSEVRDLKHGKHISAVAHFVVNAEALAPLSPEPFDRLPLPFPFRQFLKPHSEEFVAVERKGELGKGAIRVRVYAQRRFPERLKPLHLRLQTTLLSFLKLRVPQRHSAKGALIAEL